MLIFGTIMLPGPSSWSTRDNLGDNGTILERTVPDMKSSDFSCQESAQAVVGHIPIK